MMKAEASTFWAEIAIAGDYDDARRCCREFCEVGLCVTVTRTSYTYTGGEQSGVLVRLINYPRFPKTPDEIEKTARELAEYLRSSLCQDSYTVITPEKTTWFTRRSSE